jgi:hypothetical protein
MKRYWNNFRRNMKSFFREKGERWYYLCRAFEFIEDAERWIAYRTYDKYHIVKTGLSPHYYDKDEILLYANFSILVDFVEHELAHMYTIFDEDKQLRWNLTHCPETFGRRFGLAHLDWEKKLLFNKDDYSDTTKGMLTDQAKKAKVIEKCYLFWKDQYLPNKEILEGENNLDGLTCLYIEDFWEDLASKRLSQLMKVRRGLWT